MNNWTDGQKGLWEFLLHAETILTDRTNFFLLAQSVFITAMLLSKTSNEKILFDLIIGGGLMVSILWLLLGVKMYIRLHGIVHEVKKFFPEYKELVTVHDFPISSNSIIAFLLPIIFIGGWLTVIEINL